jgi:hypothetical protein
MADTFGQYGLHEDAAEGPAILTTAVVSRVSQVLAPVPQSDSDLAIQLSAFFRVLHDAYFSSLEEIDNINEAQEVALDRARGQCSKRFSFCSSTSTQGGVKLWDVSILFLDECENMYNIWGSSYDYRIAARKVMEECVAIMKRNDGGLAQSLPDSPKPLNKKRFGLDQHPSSSDVLNHIDQIRARSKASWIDFRLPIDKGDIRGQIVVLSEDMQSLNSYENGQCSYREYHGSLHVLLIQSH